MIHDICCCFKCFSAPLVCPLITLGVGASNPMLKFYPRYIAIKILRLYQKTFSPDHGLFRRLFPFGYCRFQPTCSEYAVQALEKYGFLKGGLKAIWRVLRCNPWSKGGVDPV